ncbi:MAG: Ig-like domain-containing protein [candidate division NC10 bacterium]
MKRVVCITGACVLITMLHLPRSASAINFIFIDNGISGDGFWQVRSSEGGTTTTAFLDPTGSPAGISGKTQIIFQYFNFVDVGADGGGEILHNTTITTPANLTGLNEVTSAGLFEGENGTISWTAVSFIEPGSPLYLTELTFTSDNPFGPVRLIQYLDEDVEGSTDDVLIPIGTPGADDFQLLTLDDNIPIGVSHSATYNTAVGMTYIGWAADRFNDLRNTIGGAGVTYSIPGEVDTTDLPEIIGGDSRFPGLPAFGPADISSAIAFDLDPEATFASVIFALGGSLAGEPPPGPTPTTPQCTPPPSGLVSWWPADGDFADIADANTGTGAGAVTFVPGKVGQAFKFNGDSDSFITLPNNPNLLPASHTFTIDGWMKIDDVSNQFDTLLAKRDGCGEAEISYLLTVNKGFVSPDFVFPPVRELQLVMSTADGSTARATSASTNSVVPVDGQYHHVAGTYDGSFMRVYIDGQLVGETPYSGPIVPTHSPAVISHHGGMCTERSAAAIDELEFYDRALSPEEIQEIFAADSAGKCELPPIFPAAPSTPDLVDESDRGISNTDNITNDSTPTFVGTAPPDSTVELFANGSSLGTTPADGTGAWSLTTTLAQGVHTITATATDVAGNVSDPSLPLSVTIDTTGPIIVSTRTPGPNAFGWNNTDVTVIFECVDALSGLAPGSPPPATTVSTEGANQAVTGSCQDVAGNTAEYTTEVNIDKTAPRIAIDKPVQLIADLSAHNCTLWPPNHKLVEVARLKANDALSGLSPESLYVYGTSNEPEDGRGYRNSTPDIVVSGGRVQLRAERSGTGNGRVYTITASATDQAGNSAMTTVTCTVPHDQGHGKKKKQGTRKAKKNGKKR